MIRIKVLQINTVYKIGSTGKIAYEISELCKENGIENICAAAPVNKRDDGYIKIGSYYGRYLNVLLSRVTGLNGCFAFFATKKFLRKVKKEKFDLIHLHNLHDSYINLPLLFKFIKKNNIPVVWTLHDCWSFTGHCPYFTAVHCDKWKTGCFDCPRYKEYPVSFFDNSKFMYRLKRKWFTDIKNLTIITPSEWLGELAKQSFLKEYPVKVINNGINLEIFKPTLSDFREKYACENKFIVLGVAFGWGERKGIDVFTELSSRLESDKYQIVLVGTDENIDKTLPNNIISIHRTNNQNELAEIYSAADLFFIPTREENYPTVNMEAIACGTPVLTFKTGGSPEIADEKCGFVTDENSIEEAERIIRQVEKNNSDFTQACLQRAKSFDKNDKYKEYLKIYGAMSGSQKAP